MTTTASTGTDGLRVQIAFLTGQSDPRRCALSPAQDAFLHQLSGAGRQLLTHNFPYRQDDQPYAITPLWRASLRNGTQYLAARRETVGMRHRDHVLDLLERTPRTILLTGSCGLELLHCLKLPPDVLARLSVFAYGPVARHTPACRWMAVQGRRDWISRLGFRGPVTRVEGGHMNYLLQDDVMRHCRAFIASVMQGDEQAGPCVST